MLVNLKAELRQVWQQLRLALKNAIESQDVEAQIAAQEQLANLSIDDARLNALKSK